VSLMTLHNAKGLEFPIVFLAGLEEGLFPHSRSIESSPAMLEEERRLCYVGMTRARRRLILSWARYRRRFGGGLQERTVRSRFLDEVPPHLIQRYGEEEPAPPELDLTAERQAVRQTVKKNAYTGKTYNSLENISQFFAERGIKAGGPPASPAPVARQIAPSVSAGTTQAPRKQGSTVVHPKYGKGVIVRREGEGEDAKLTVSFPGHGLKKLVEKYAGLKRD